MTTATHISTNQLRRWKSLQFLLWVVGLFVVLSLFFKPEVGLDALWNVLIPLAPALLVVSPGLWRNICPLGFTTLLPRYSNRSARKQLSPRGQTTLSIGGLLLLLLIVPLRHVLFDTNGPATGLLLISLALLGIILGRKYEWKSAWCSGLCPVYPVEKLYGVNPVAVPRNAHCTLCEQCVIPCPDSTKSMHPLATRKIKADRLAGTILVGSFPGFVWGWFQLPDYVGEEKWGHLPEAYFWPLLGGAVTLVIFLIISRVIPKKEQSRLIRIFACGAVACYYWFRLPLLFGFGAFPGSGMLMDLSSTIPPWLPYLLQGSTTLLFAWLLLWREVDKKQSWTIRPPFAGTS